MKGKDTGSAKVQIEILTQRIQKIAVHIKSAKQDKHSLRGLKMLSNRRKKLVRYQETKNKTNDGTY